MTWTCRFTTLTRYELDLGGREFKMKILPESSTLRYLNKVEGEGKPARKFLNNVKY